MVKKYLCIGGYVYSKNDGDRHYISPYRLPDLYKVNRHECLYSEDGSDLLGVNTADYIILRPDPTGKYQLPKP